MFDTFPKPSIKIKKGNKKYWIAAGLLGLWFFYQFILGLFAVDVSVAEVRRGTAIKAVSGTITVEAEVETQLLATGNGFLTKSKLVEGKDIAKGEELASIDPGDLPFKIENARIEIEKLAAALERGAANSVRLKTLKRKREQSERLLREGHMSQSDFDDLVDEITVLQLEVNTEMDELRTNLQVRKNEMEQLRDDLGRLTIVAPMDGTITHVHAHSGDLVSKGNPLADIISDEMKISAEVNQDDIEVIRKGGTANVRFFAFGNRLFKAEVRQVLPSSDAETQRFTVYLNMVEQPETMFPGMTGEVSFLASEHPNTLIIPRRALVGDFVYVLDGSKVERRKVRTGYLSYSDAEILEGVEEDEKVVTEKLDLLRDGDRVNIERILQR